ncbi:MAG TPA: hypothetical protein VFN41_08625 [Candidatus Limnocylindrales bacterium]|nr:hypothetical protein [Candidatus Limnocylindrales bacterium]
MTTLLIGVLVMACGGAVGPATAPTSPAVSAPTASDAIVEPTPDATQALPTEAASLAPSVTTVEPTPRASLPIGPKPTFRAGDIVMTISDRVRVRSKPGVSADSIKYEPLLRIGSDVKILRGPTAASGYWWYRVHLEDGLTLRDGVDIGWIAAADHDGEPWIGEPGLDCCEGDPGTDGPALPIPVVERLGTEAYVDAFGDPYVRYDLSVTNWNDYPAELFAPAPHLEPCGTNTNASRTWVDIIDVEQYERVYGFCGLGQPEDLTGIWFGVPSGALPPAQISVVLTDRETSASAESEPVDMLDTP